MPHVVPKTSISINDSHSIYFKKLDISFTFGDVWVLTLGLMAVFKIANKF